MFSLIFLFPDTILEQEGAIIMTPMINFAKKISKMGGRAYLVGGFVRDQFLDEKSHDHDILITGITKKDFEKEFPMAFESGNKFPVYRMEMEVEEKKEVIEIAFARKEKSIGAGHNDYEILFTPNVTVEEDLYRRDLTMNSMAMDVITREIVDPFGGKNSIKNGVISATSKHFIEDPLRALRAARQAAKFKFEIDDKTIEMMTSCHDGIKTLSMERIVVELKKALSTNVPSVFFRELNRAQILDVCFPQVFRLIGQTQPEAYHPEGDAFEHTMLVLDKVSQKTDNVKIRFAALMHDIGKGTTPKELLPKHFGHDKAGVDVIKNMPSQYPKEWKRLAILVAETHMNVINMAKTGKIVKTLLNVKRIPMGLETLRTVVEADSNAIPWFLEDKVTKALQDLHVEIPDDVADIKGFVLTRQAAEVAKFKA